MAVVGVEETEEGEASAAVTGADVAVEGIEGEEAFGEVIVAVVVEVGPDAVVLRRFAFLGMDSFLSCTSISQLKASETPTYPWLPRMGLS